MNKLNFIAEKILAKLHRLKRRVVSNYSKQKTIRELKTEVVQCIICEDSHHLNVISKEDRYGLPITTVECARCGLVFTNPMPTQKFLDYFYSSGLYRGLYKGFLKANSKFVEIDKSKERALERISFAERIAMDKIEANISINVLDFGCSEGTFPKEFKLKHPTIMAYGLEPGNSFSSINKENIDGMFDQAEDIPPQIRFNLITMWHVLEHLRNPLNVLKQLVSTLDKNGKIIIEVPDYTIHSSRNRPFHIGHVYHFTDTTLTKLLYKAGLKIAHIGRTGTGELRAVAETSADQHD